MIKWYIWNEQFSKWQLWNKHLDSSRNEWTSMSSDLVPLQSQWPKLGQPNCCAVGPIAMGKAKKSISAQKCCAMRLTPVTWLFISLDLAGATWKHDKKNVETLRNWSIKWYHFGASTNLCVCYCMLYDLLCACTVLQNGSQLLPKNAEFPQVLNSLGVHSFPQRAAERFHPHLPAPEAEIFDFRSWEDRRETNNSRLQATGALYATGPLLVL